MIFKRETFFRERGRELKSERTEERERENILSSVLIGNMFHPPFSPSGILV